MQNKVDKNSRLLHCDLLFVTKNVNPADIGTRSKHLGKIHFDLLWNGPKFLLGCRQDWSSQGNVLSQKERGLKERVSRNTVLNVVIGSVGIGIITSCERFISRNKVLKITSYGTICV